MHESVASPEAVNFLACFEFWSFLNYLLKSAGPQVSCYVIIILLSTVEYMSVSPVYSTVDSDITNLIQDRLVRLCALKREEVRRQGQSD